MRRCIPFLTITTLLFCSLTSSNVLAQRPRTLSEETTGLVIKAPPNTVIWIDRLRYGKTGDDGTLIVKNARPGSHILRARLKGKREVTKTFDYPQGSSQEVQVKLTAPADKAELHFQMAEELREAGKHPEALKEYRQAMALRKGGYAAARIGLARSLMATEKYEDAVVQARAAVRDSGGRNGEAYTVIANTRRFQGLYDQAIIGYETALEQSHGFSPEAHTGLALTFQDRNRAEEAIKHFRIGAEQSNDTEPIIYFLMGGALERENRLKEALVAYEKFLELDPNGRQTTAVRSIIKQLKRSAQW